MRIAFSWLLLLQELPPAVRPQNDSNRSIKYVSGLIEHFRRKDHLLEVHVSRIRAGCRCVVQIQQAPFRHNYNVHVNPLRTPELVAPLNLTCAKLRGGSSHATAPQHDHSTAQSTAWSTHLESGSQRLTNRPTQPVPEVALPGGLALHEAVWFVMVGIQDLLHVPQGHPPQKDLAHMLEDKRRNALAELVPPLHRKASEMFPKVTDLLDRTQDIVMLRFCAARKQHPVQLMVLLYELIELVHEVFRVVYRV